MGIDERMMRAALKEAQIAKQKGEVAIGAVIADGDTVIARAHNRVIEACDPTAHAEIVAIRAATQLLGSPRLEGLTLYVTLEPCPMCAGAILQSRCKRLVFGAYDVQYGCAGSVYRIPEDPAFHHFTRVDGGILAEECAQMLRETWGRA